MQRTECSVTDRFKLAHLLTLLRNPVADEDGEHAWKQDSWSRAGARAREQMSCQQIGMAARAVVTKRYDRAAVLDAICREITSVVHAAPRDRH